MLMAALETDGHVYRVWATCNVDNERSTQLLERAGFVLEGRLARHAVYPTIGPSHTTACSTPRSFANRRTLSRMIKPTVLISGAGIAGPTLAYWLTRSGYHVVVVELADGIRPGGQTVDLRGAGREVVERMGLLDQLRARSLDQRGIAWVKADGTRRAEMPVDAFRGSPPPTPSTCPTTRPYPQGPRAPAARRRARRRRCPRARFSASRASRSPAHRVRLSTAALRTSRWASASAVVSPDIAGAASSAPRPTARGPRPGAPATPTPAAPARRRRGFLRRNPIRPARRVRRRVPADRGRRPAADGVGALVTRGQRCQPAAAAMRTSRLSSPVAAATPSTSSTDTSARTASIRTRWSGSSSARR